MSIKGLDTSGLSAGLQKSIDVLWEGREMSADMKSFFNDFEKQSPEMQKHWETYYKNLEKAMVSIHKTKALVGEQKSCFEGGTNAKAGLAVVENGGRAAVLGGGGIVVFSGATVAPTETSAEAKKKAGTFGIIGLLKPDQAPARCPK